MDSKSKKISIYSSRINFMLTSNGIKILKIVFLMGCSLCVSRCVTCPLVWRRCWSDTNWPIIPTDPWLNALCATRSSPATTTSKSIWRTSTERRRDRQSFTTPIHIHIFIQAMYKTMYKKDAYIHRVYTTHSFSQALVYCEWPKICSVYLSRTSLFPSDI